VPKAIVCGAGAAGLGAAAALQRVGAETVVLERGNQVGTSWRNRYDGLRLNTTAFMSTLPGFRARRSRYGEFPTRDSWVQYLEDYRTHHRLAVEFETDVQRIDGADGGLSVRTDSGPRDADFVVVATGYDREPNVPDWPGAESFTGELIHSSSYRSPAPYVGSDVLVVGPGTTGSEIAHLLVAGGAGRVRVATRTPPNLIRRKFLGMSVNATGIALNRAPLRAADGVTHIVQRILFGDLTPYGIPKAPVGAATALKLHHRTPVYDEGFVGDLRAGRIEIVPAVVGFDDDDVLLADGSHLQPDVVIAATGFGRGLDDLVGHLGVLDADGIPTVHGGVEHPNAPGLFFNGYRADLSGQLRLMRGGARSIAAAVSARSGARP
jgi:putative flavoprotein involved in K+ transport